MTFPRFFCAYSLFDVISIGLRHLSQGCLDQYASEARQLGVRVAESRRQLQSTVAQRLYAEQLLMEARGQQQQQQTNSTDLPGGLHCEGFTSTASSVSTVPLLISPCRQISPKEADSSSGLSRESGELDHETATTFEPNHCFLPSSITVACPIVNTLNS